MEGDGQISVAVHVFFVGTDVECIVVILVEDSTTIFIYGIASLVYRIYIIDGQFAHFILQRVGTDTESTVLVVVLNHGEDGIAVIGLHQLGMIAVVCFCDAVHIYRVGMLYQRIAEVNNLG